MENLFTSIITIDDFKEYQSGWSENFEDKQIQDAINIATNDLNAYTNFLLERVYVYNTGEDVKQSNPLWRNELEMKALKMSVLSQTYYKLMNGNDNSIGDASFSGAGVSMSQSLPERNYIAEDVLQWLINARLINNDGEKKTHKHFIKDIVCDDLSQNPLEIVKRPYPDPVYVPSKFNIFTPYNLLQVNEVGNVVQVSLDDVMKYWTLPEETLTYIEEYILSNVKEDIKSIVDEELIPINQSISNIEDVLIPNKANITLDNVNVGSGKENKILSFDENGNTKFVEQSTSGFVFEKEIELTNAYNGTSTTQIGNNLYRVDGISWNNDNDLKEYFDGKHYFILQNMTSKHTIYLSGISSSINANNVLETNTNARDFPIYNIVFLPTNHNNQLFNLQNNIGINDSTKYINFTSWFGSIYAIQTIILVSGVHNEAFDWPPETYKFKIKVIKL